jgi:hypothetical protein
LSTGGVSFSEITEGRKRAIKQAQISSLINQESFLGQQILISFKATK